MRAWQKQDVKMEKGILTASSPWESHVVINIMDSFEPQDEEQGGILFSYFKMFEGLPLWSSG